MKRMKLKRFLVSIMLIIVTFTSFTCLGEDGEHTTKSIDSTNIIHNIDSINNIAVINKKNDVRTELVAEVSNYISKQAANAHKVIPEQIVSNCLEHNVDICFVMAQTQNETNFGTTGAGRSTSRKSMFGVAKKHYSTYEDAIDDYFIILKKSYLTTGKTEYDLMKNYVTRGGSRYASSKSYEVHLQKTYAQIKYETNIYNLQKHYQTL